MKKLILLSICLLLSMYVVNAQTVSPTYSDVDYVGKGNSKQMLDIYIPAGINKATATIVHIHGGAFMMEAKGHQVNQLLFISTITAIFAWILIIV